MICAPYINQAKDFGYWLHKSTNEKPFSGGIRERTGHAILQHTMDIADAIIVLIEVKLPGPALTLARPLFEGYVRGFWLLNYATDVQITKFLEGKCPNFGTLLAAIPEDTKSGGAWIHNNSKINLTSFHGLTHDGSEHVIRRNRYDSIEPSYPVQELVSLIRFGNEIRSRIGAELFALFEDEEGMKKLKDWSQILRAES